MKRELQPITELDLQRHELDFIKEKQCDSQLRVTTYQRRTTRYFNSKVKTRRFQIGNLILKKVLHSKGALDPSWEGSYKITRILNPDAYQLAHLNGDWVPRSWNADHLKIHYQ